MGPSWRRMWIFLGVFAHVFPGRRSSLNASPLEIKVSWLQFEQNLCDLNPFPLSEALRRVGAHRIPGLYRRRKKKTTKPTPKPDESKHVFGAGMQILHSWALEHDGCFAEEPTAPIPLPRGTETSGPNPKMGRAGGGAGSGLQRAPAQGREPKSHSMA